MIISAKKEVFPHEIVLRAADEAECQADGMTGPEAVMYSIQYSDWHEAVYIDDGLVAVWGYYKPSLFSYRCQAWLLTTDLVEDHKIWFTRCTIRCLRHLFERFEEVEVQVHEDHKLAREWLNWLCFDNVGQYKGFITMLAKRSESRWVS